MDPGTPRYRIASWAGPLELRFCSHSGQLFAIDWADPGLENSKVLPGPLRPLAVALGEVRDLRSQPELLAGCDWTGMSPWRREVLAACFQRLGPGERASYGQLAQWLGAGRGAARAVGQALRANPFPILIPCHRVVAQQGLGGFMGKSPEGQRRKAALLAIEAGASL